MIDLEITLRRLTIATAWVVELRSTEDPTFLVVPPLTDQDLAAIPDLAPAARTWKGFLTSLSPGSPLPPGPATLRAVGGILMTKILGDAQVRDHLAAVEKRAEKEKRPVRLLVNVEDDDPALDPILTCLPVELAHDGTRFFFKRRNRPAFRIAPQSEARNLRLRRGSRVLVATAHADGRAPDRDTLLAHARAVTEAVRKSGFEATHLTDATSETLRSAILSSPAAVDILYMVCHGTEDPDYAGRLVLRDTSLDGLELARWLEDAVPLGRQVQVVALCACSSASPAVDAGTLSMAQWVVRPGRALASLGFRGPVGVDWALRWSERLFRRLGEGAPLEDAFAEAQNGEKDSEPQWVLPVLYARRRDLEPAEEKAGVRWRDVLLSFAIVRRALEGIWDFLRTMLQLLAGFGSLSEGGTWTPRNLPRPHRRARMPAEHAPPRPQLPFTPPPLPRQPRPYFTGRTRDLKALADWTHEPGAAQITAVEGEGGIGKTEVAAVLAHALRSQGKLVVWVERADKDVRGALVTLIELREPAFKATPETTLEDLAARMRRNLGPYPGLMVLDDISAPDVVDVLRPGEGWNVLVTTRTRGLVPGALEVGLGPLGPEDALRLLSRVAWDRAEPPAEQRAGAERLVERLGYLPLALEMAGRTLRNLVTPEEYLASLDLGEGVADSDRERVHAVLLRSLNDVDAGDERVFLALGVWPAPGATAEWMSWGLEEPEPTMARRLDRLGRANLVRWSSETGRYRLHPLLRDAARERAQGREEVWNELHGGMAAAMDKLAYWIKEPIGKKAAVSWQRWKAVRDVVDSLDPVPWAQGASGGVYVARLLSTVHEFRHDRTPAEREMYLDQAERLSRDDTSWRRANVLMNRGHLRRNRGNLEGAACDYDEALELYRTGGSLLGQANLLKARGHLGRDRNDLEGAARDYDDALELFRALESRLGQANVLKARGDLRRSRHDLEGAARDYDDAQALFLAVESRLGQAYVLQARGDLARERRDWAQALLWYEEALTLYREFQDFFDLGNTLAEIARARKELGQPEAAVREAAEEALRFAIPSENRHAERLAREVLEPPGGTAPLS